MRSQREWHSGVRRGQLKFLFGVWRFTPAPRTRRFTWNELCRVSRRSWTWLTGPGWGGYLAGWWLRQADHGSPSKVDHSHSTARPNDTYHCDEEMIHT